MSQQKFEAFKRESRIVDAGDSSFITTTVVIPDKKTDTFEKCIISPWGSDNKFPAQALEYTRKSSILAAALRDITAFTYGMGIFTYKVKSINPDGTEVIEVVHDKKVDEFFEFSMINRYLKMAIDDYYTLGNACPWFIMKEGKVHQLRAIKIARARLEKVNPSTGKKDYVWESAQWDNEAWRSITREKSTQDKQFYKKIRLLDPWDYQWQIGQTQFKKEKELACWIDDYTSDRDYYHDAAWHSAILNGWLDIDIGVPKMKQALFNNSITIKYKISINVRYWEDVYGEAEWKNMKAEEKTKVKNEKFDEIEKCLKGAEKAYKSITSQFYVNTNGEIEHDILIEVIDDKIKDGAYLPDSQQAAAIICAAIGLDPAISGISIPSAVTNSRSGSDKREALFILNNKLKIVRDAILEPLVMIKNINGWDADLRFGFRNIELTTLDKNPTGQKEKLNG